MLKKIDKNIRALLDYAKFKASGLAVRDKNLWVFGNLGDVFDGNSKYLFLWVSKNLPGVRAVWITANETQRAQIRSLGYESELRGSRSGAAARLKAGVYLFNAYPADVGADLANGAFLVNLWHGSGLKAVGATNKRSSIAKVQGRKPGLLERARRLRKTLAPNLIVTTSPALAQKFADSYGLPLEHLPIIGTPRLDGALDADLKAAVKAFQSNTAWDTARKEYAEVFVYMPTFREGHLSSKEDRSDFLREALPNVARLSEALARRNAVLYVKQHPRAMTKLEFDHANIRPWPTGLDFYSVIDEVDGLITDYSSVMFDYLRVKPRGLVLYPFDLEKYLSERDLYFSYEESVAGVRADTFEKLCELIESGAAINEIDQVAADRAFERCWAGSVHPAAAHVVAEIQRRLGNSKETA